MQVHNLNRLSIEEGPLTTRIPTSFSRRRRQVLGSMPEPLSSGWRAADGKSITLPLISSSRNPKIAVLQYDCRAPYTSQVSTDPAQRVGKESNMWELLGSWEPRSNSFPARLYYHFVSSWLHSSIPTKLQSFWHGSERARLLHVPDHAMKATGSSLVSPSSTLHQVEGQGLHITTAPTITARTP